MTENCVELTEKKAKWYAEEDFKRYLEYNLFVYPPIRLSAKQKDILIIMLSVLKNQFEKLISRTDVDEPEVQDFLEDHSLLIDLNAIRILPKQELGRKNEADFILLYEDSIRVVEIKKPHDLIFEKLIFSSLSKLALYELERYQGWLISNALIAKKRFGSDVLKEGWGIIGRMKDMNDEQMKKLQTYNSQSEKKIIKTYDDLLKNFDLRINQIKNVQ